MGEKTKQLAGEREALNVELVALKPAQNVVELHPAVLARFEDACRRLQNDIGKTIEEGDPKSALAIRDLVESVTVWRDPERPEGLAVTIVGRLETLLGAPFPRMGGTVVAGEGLEPPTYGL
jgi:site-specific DNA recombinase